ncbi:MAG: tetratricopeptide repeat protein [Nannocystales bacterium]
MNENERAALAEYRGSLGRKQPEQDRDWARLVSKIEAGAQPLSVELEARPRRRWLPWGLGAAVAVLSAVWAWPEPEPADAAHRPGGAQAAYGAGEQTSSASVRSQSLPVRSVDPGRQPSTSGAPSVEPDLPPAPVPALAPEARRGIVDRRSRAPASGREVEPAAEVPKTHNVVAEAKALREIRAALRDQDGRHALGLLRRYRSRFPTGVLRDEATVLHADALCLDGQRERARTIAARFARSHPRSPLAGRARGLCEDS